MEEYIDEINRIANADYSVFVTDAPCTGSMPSSAIIIVTEMFDTCPSVLELTNLLNKRLRNIGSLRSGLTRTAIAIACLCSEGYSVNHKSIRGVTLSEMRNLWGTFETAKVSSSPDLSSWLAKITKGRSEAGYAQAHGEVSTGGGQSARLLQKRRYIRDSRRAPEVVSTLFSERYFGTANTVKDAMIVDMKMLSAIRFLESDSVPTFRPSEGSHV